ncbi:MAG TPA: cellulase family glycosylhydrolase [Allocoleopsis sp.]
MTPFFQWITQVFSHREYRRILTAFQFLRRRFKSINTSLDFNAIAFRSRTRRSIHWHWIGAVLIFLLIVLTQNFQTIGSAVNAATTTTIQLPLSTNGSTIVDAAGKQVLLRGVNWFGMETETHTPHGLWVRDYKAMLAQIKSLGYNVIRLPYSVQALRASTISGVDFSIGSNKDLQGKTPLQVMDLIIQEAQRQGLFILLDSHQLNDYSIPELWYGDGFTEADWINTWKLLATRYKNQTNVIGADLKNEPHGQARWGNNNQATDWRLAAERCGSAIQAIAPNWLIVVEGVGNVPEKNQWYWDGGNLVDVKQYPVRLSIAKKLVYSPHEYGPGVYNASWFSDPTFPNNMPARWETGFNYIATQGIAPILIGEFGGRQVDTVSKEGIWQRKFVDFIKQKNLSFTYWSWNPNSADTGGILLNDWTTVDAAKQQLLNTLLPVASASTTSSGSGTTSSSTTAITNSVSGSTTLTSSSGTTSLSLSSNASSSTSGTTNVSGSPQLKATALIQSDEKTRVCVNLQVTNQGNASTRNWQLTFAPNQATLTQAWGGNFLPQGTKYLVVPESWQQVIQPNQTVTVGYCANKQGSNYKPTQISVFNL